MLTAPCEPPDTSSVGRSGSRPNSARASAGLSVGCVMERFIGSPIRRDPRMVVSGNVVAT